MTNGTGGVGGVMLGPGGVMGGVGSPVAEAGGVVVGMVAVAPGWAIVGVAAGGLVGGTGGGLSGGLGIAPNACIISPQPSPWRRMSKISATAVPVSWLNP